MTEQQILTELSKRALNYSSVRLNNANASYADMQETALYNTLGYSLQGMVIDNRSKALSAGILQDTYGFTIHKATNETYSSGRYEQNNDNFFGLDTPIGRIGVKTQNKNTKNQNEDPYTQGRFHDFKSDNKTVKYGVNNVLLPTIKIKHRRSKGNYYR